MVSGYMKLDKFKLLQLLEKSVKSEIGGIVDKVMDRFDDEIVPYEDEADPAKPSLCREEFRQFLVDNLNESIKVVNNFVEIELGDDRKLGFGEELDEETTEKYLYFSAKKTEAEVNEDCMPSGPSLLIQISPVFESTVSIANGEDWEELGEVSIKLE